MEEGKFIILAERTLIAIEKEMDKLFSSENDFDIETVRNGSVLNITINNTFQIVINIQTPMQQIWMAAKTGGFHYQYIDGQWKNIRDESTLDKTLSKILCEVIKISNINIELLI